MLVALDPLIITSPYGERIRNGKKEFHPGVDLKVVDKEWNPFSITAPESMIITRVDLDPNWGHFIEAKADKPEDDFYNSFRFFHLVPHVDVAVDQLFDEGVVIGMPESGWVPLHLHFEVKKNGKTIDPKLYFNLKGVEYK
jgi:murein DD-endopeptidase MepM/ murein hydrolase activator NlpD